MSGRQHGYGQHLIDGLQILRARWVSRPVGWVKKGATDRARVGRGVALAAAAWVLVRVVVSSWKILIAVVLVVGVLALRAATKAMEGGLPKPASAHADGLPDVSADQFMGLLHDVLGVASGVHLRTLAAALTTRHGGAWEIADVRRLCEAAGVPITPTVRAPGGKPTVGVYRADLPPLPDPSPTLRPSPVVGVVVAGQPGTTPPTTATSTTPTTPTVTSHGGLRIVTTDDPDNPARAHVQIIDGARKKRA